MRAFLVLLIVAALGVGAYLYFGQSGESNDTPADYTEGISNQDENTTTTEETPDNQADLQGIDTSNTRTVTAPETAGTEGTGQATVVADPSSQTGTVLGRVVNQKGASIEGAQVTLTQFGGASLFFAGPDEVDRSKDLKTTTNSDGEFSFEEVAPFAMYTLIADHEGYARVEVTPIDLTGGAVVEQELRLGSGTRLFGAIRDVQGNAVPNADVTLAPVAIGAGPGTDSPDQRKVQSDALGNYEFPHCAVGNYVMSVNAEGYGQATIQNLSIAGPDDIERNVELEAAMLMGGRITDQNGNGIPNATVNAYLIASRGNRTQSMEKSGEDGVFEFSNVASGAYTLRAVAKGFKPNTLPRANAGEMNLEIQLVPLPTISGQVFDNAGNPITSYTINLRQGVSNSDLSMPVRGSQIQVNDPEGRYTLTLPNTGEFMAEAKAGGYAPSLSPLFNATDGQNLTGINVTMTSGGIIRGKLVDKSGNPIANARINTENNEWTGSMFDQTFGDGFPGMSTKKKATSNQDGEFVLRGLHPTKYLIQIEHDDFAKTAMKNVVVSEGTETPLGNVTLEKGSVVTGVVRGPGGTPVSAATVELWLETTTEFPLHYTVRSNPEGVYELKNVRSGNYWISAQRPSSGGNNPFAGAADSQNSRRKISISPDGRYQGEDFEFNE